MKKEEKEMKKNNYIKVKFMSSRDESQSIGYVYLDEIGCKVFDFVLVPTKYGVSMAMVVETGVSNDLCDSVLKSVIEVITANYFNVITRDLKAKQLEKQLEAKIKSLDKMAKFKMYAEMDSEFATMLSDLETLKAEGK